MAILQWMDFWNSSILPFMFMTVSSVGLIRSIRASRSRISRLSGSSNSQLKRDNRFAVTIISLNFIFLILNLPLVFDQILSVYVIDEPIFDYLSEILYFLYFAIDFYTQLFVNIEFRREAFKLFRLELKSKSATTDNNIRRNGRNSTFNAISES